MSPAPAPGGPAAGAPGGPVGAGHLGEGRHGGAPDAARPTPPGQGEPTAWDQLRGWRPTRRGLAPAALVMLALTVLTLTSPRPTGDLDPSAVDPGGSRAVASVLRDLGVEVTDVRTTRDVRANAPGSTVLVTETATPSASMVAEVLEAGPARVVLVDPRPSDAWFDRLAAGISPAAPVGDHPREPGCALPAALAARTAALPGTRYDARGRAGAVHACYDSAESASVVVLPERAGSPEVVLLGSPHLLTNAGFDEQGNAALALDLLGSRQHLVWWRPTPTDPALAGEPDATLTDLIPAWVAPVALQTLIASMVVVWWRARRLGPLVVEPLPVVVRAGEATAGRARLLHAHHARGEAAEHLRARARERIRARLGLPAGADADRLVAAAAGRSGRTAQEVGDLLYGPDPGTDVQLATLGHHLDALMVEVRG